jgi:hypothetical protein
MKPYTIVYHMPREQLTEFYDQYIELQAVMTEIFVGAKQRGDQFPEVVKMLDTIKNKQYNKD